MNLKDLLINACLVLALLIGILTIGILIQKYETATIEREIKEYQKVEEIAEVTLKQKQVKNESIRQDLETIRLQAFIKAYSRGEYIVENFISEGKK